MTQRPKLVLGFVLALVVAGLVGLVGRLIADIIPRASWWPEISAPVRTRSAAAIILVLSIVALYLSGLKVDTAELGPALTLAIAASVGALAALFGLELAPLVTGLVIGQLMQGPLQSALGKSGGNAVAALTSGSSGLLVLAVAAVVAMLAWPLVGRRVSSS